MRVLLLAGTAEARRLARELGTIAKLDLIASLAGETRQPADLMCKTRIGGFGSEAGFQRYLLSNDINAVIDATHPFAAKMSSTAARICQQLALPHVRLLRPEWRVTEGDNWHIIEHGGEVARLVQAGQNVFLATGRKSLAAFSNLEQCRVICRVIEPSQRPFPMENGCFVTARPPFSLEAEMRLFRSFEIDWLVVKNSGGEAGRAKLDAARALKIPVAMIRRPTPPDCLRVSDVGAAVTWVNARLGKG